MGTKHDLDSIFPLKTAVPYAQNSGVYAGTTPFCYPQSLSGSAGLEFRPIPSCLGCPIAQTAGHHSLYQFRWIDTGTGEAYTGGLPIDQEYSYWGLPEMLRRGQQLLFNLPRWTDPIPPLRLGFPGGTIFNCLKYDMSETPNWFQGGWMTVTSASGNQITVDGTDYDIRQSPVDAGWYVFISGNNCASRLIGRVKEITASEILKPGCALPSTVTFTLDMAVTPAINTAMNPDNDWTASIFVCSETWAEERTFIEHPAYFYGVRREVFFDTSNSEWTNRIFPLRTESEADCAVCYPTGAAGDSIDSRTLIVQKRVAGEWQDITTSVNAIYDGTNEDAARLIVTHPAGDADHSQANSKLYLGEHVGFGMTTDFLSDADAVKIAFYWENQDTWGGTYKSCPMASGKCKHCKPAFGNVWGESGLEDGVKWYCSKWQTASGYSNFAPSRCFLPGKCDEFEAHSPSDFLTEEKVKDILFEYITGSPCFLQQQAVGVSSIDNWKWYHSANARSSFTSLLNPSYLLTYPPSPILVHQIPHQTSMFGLESGEIGYALKQGLIHEYIPDFATSLYTYPAAGVLPEFYSWSGVKDSIDNTDLNDTTDPYAEGRRTIINHPSTDRIPQTIDNWTEGKRVMQRLAQGAESRSENVLVSNLDPTSTGLQSTVNGYWQFGPYNFNQKYQIEKVSEASAFFGALMKINPLPYSTATGNVWIGGTIAKMTNLGDNEWEIEIEPAQEQVAWGYHNGEEMITIVSTFYCGGNFVTVPEYWQINSPYASVKWNRLGKGKGCEAGHVVYFPNSNKGQIDEFPEGNDHHYFQVLEAEACVGTEFNWENGQAPVSEPGNTDWFNSIAGPAGAANALPANFVGVGNRRDKIKIKDSRGCLNFWTSFDGEEFVGKDIYCLIGVATLPHDADEPELYYTTLGTDDWTQIPAADVWEINRVNGMYGIRKSAITTLKNAVGSNKFCIKAVCNNGRYGHTRFMDATSFNDAKAGLEALHTARCNIYVGGAKSYLKGGKFAMITGWSSEPFNQSSGITSTRQGDITGADYVYVQSLKCEKDWKFKKYGSTLIERTDAESLEQAAYSYGFGWDVIFPYGSGIQDGMSWWQFFPYHDYTWWDNDIELEPNNDYDAGQAAVWVAGTGGWYSGVDPTYLPLMTNYYAHYIDAIAIDDASLLVEFNQNVTYFEPQLLNWLPDSLTIEEAICDVSCTCTNFVTWEELIYLVEQPIETLVSYDGSNPSNIAEDYFCSNGWAYETTATPVVQGTQLNWEQAGDSTDYVYERYGAAGQYNIEHPDPSDQRVRAALVGIKPDGSYVIIGASEEFAPDGVVRRISIKPWANSYYQNRAGAYARFGLLVVAGAVENAEELDGVFPELIEQVDVAEMPRTVAGDGEASLGLEHQDYLHPITQRYQCTSFEGVNLHFSNMNVKFTIDGNAESVMGGMGPIYGELPNMAGS